MKIAGVVKFKHGGMWKALRKLGWSQSELARRSGLCPTKIGSTINMKRRPSTEVALCIEMAFGEAGEWVDVLSEWPDDFRMETKGEISIYREMSRDQLSSSDPQKTLEQKDVLEDALSKCNAEERELLELHYLKGWTYNDIAKRQGCTHSNIGSKIHKVLRKIRNQPVGSNQYLRVKNSMKEYTEYREQQDLEERRKSTTKFNFF